MFNSTGKTANRILDDAIRDRSGDQTRHKQRIAAMRALGASERRFDNFLKAALAVIIAVASAVVVVAISLLLHL